MVWKFFVFAPSQYWISKNKIKCVLFCLSMENIKLSSLINYFWEPTVCQARPSNYEDAVVGLTLGELDLGSRSRRNGISENLSVPFPRFIELQNIWKEVRHPKEDGLLRGPFPCLSPHPPAMASPCQKAPYFVQEQRTLSWHVVKH